jgi:hypothetical protein
MGHCAFGVVRWVAVRDRDVSHEGTFIAGFEKGGAEVLRRRCASAQAIRSARA